MTDRATTDPVEVHAMAEEIARVFDFMQWRWGVRCIPQGDGYAGYQAKEPFVPNATDVELTLSQALSSVAKSHYESCSGRLRVVEDGDGDFSVSLHFGTIYRKEDPDE